MGEFLDPFQQIDKHGGRLPHWQQAGTMQFVTFRLNDAMPSTKLRQWKAEREIWLAHHPEPWSPGEDNEYHRRFVWRLERWLDQGWGCCLLKDAAVREVMAATLLHDQDVRASHHAWVIMPNHVHLLFTANARLEILVKAWKGIAARRIGKGGIWQPGYRDTMIRHGEHFANAVRYIRRNPVRLRPDEFTLWQSERALAVK
jgi:hypothetical protein